MHSIKMLAFSSKMSSTSNLINYFKYIACQHTLDSFIFDIAVMMHSLTQFFFLEHNQL
jgi:hypothetical protein